MVGRQVTVTLCFFIIARVTTLNVKIGEEGVENVFGVSDGLQEFFNLGFLGAIITTILGSISWQLVASAFPIAFLSNPIVYALLNVALAIEFTGICGASFFFGTIHKKIAGFQLDEVYVGTAEERAAGEKPDRSMHPGRDFTMGTNVLLAPKNWEDAIKNLEPIPETYSKRRERVIANIKDMKEASKDASDAEKAVYAAGIAAEIKTLHRLNEEEENEASEGAVPVKDIESA